MCVCVTKQAFVHSFWYLSLCPCSSHQEFVLLDAGGDKSSEPVSDDLHKLSEMDADVALELAMYRPFGAGSQVN